VDMMPIVFGPRDRLVFETAMRMRQLFIISFPDIELALSTLSGHRFAWERILRVRTLGSELPLKLS
jgi:hypothetical protein